MKRLISGIVGLAAFVGGAGLVQAGVINPTEPVAGMTQLQLSEKWWQWALTIPAASNPLTDTTGAFAGTNNNGPVYFIAGNQGGSSNRSFSVPVGVPLFFPIVNFVDVEIPGAGCDLSCALGFITPAIDTVGPANLHASLNGVDLLTFPIADYRHTSTAFFPVTLPADNVFGAGPPYTETLLDAVSDGYWVALEGLTPGAHELRFGGSIPAVVGFTVDVVDDLTVPEPGSMTLLGLGLAGLVFGRRRKS